MTIKQIRDAWQNVLKNHVIDYKDSQRMHKAIKNEEKQEGKKQ